MTKESDDFEIFISRIHELLEGQDAYNMLFQQIAKDRAPLTHVVAYQNINGD